MDLLELLFDRRLIAVTTAALLVTGTGVALAVRFPPMRAVLVVEAAALVALFLGEYEFEGTLPYVAGPLVGLLLGELVVSLAKTRSLTLGLATALVASGAMLGAGAIDANGVEPIKSGAYVAGAIAAASGFLRAGALRSPNAEPVS